MLIPQNDRGVLWNSEDMSCKTKDCKTHRSFIKGIVSYSR